MNVKIIFYPFLIISSFTMQTFWVWEVFDFSLCLSIVYPWVFRLILPWMFLLGAQLRLYSINLKWIQLEQLCNFSQQHMCINQRYDKGAKDSRGKKQCRVELDNTVANTSKLPPPLTNYWGEKQGSKICSLFKIFIFCYILSSKLSPSLPPLH